MQDVKDVQDVQDVHDVQDVWDVEDVQDAQIGLGPQGLGPTWAWAQVAMGPYGAQEQPCARHAGAHPQGCLTLHSGKCFPLNPQAGLI